uniref:Uncharacterized protein n=1 Tax=Rhizophora mucronata TaxID=61149 RepID=A0A2P2N916_RHIMU
MLEALFGGNSPSFWSTYLILISPLSTVNIFMSKNWLIKKNLYFSASFSI